MPVGVFPTGISILFFSKILTDAIAGMSGGINFKFDTASGTVGRYDSKGVQLSFKTNWSIVYHAFGVGESGQDIICSINNSSRVISVFTLGGGGAGGSGSWYIDNYLGTGKKYFSSYEINVTYS